MRRAARLIVTALVLLAAMTAGAFAASSSPAPPVAADLPTIVTSLPTTPTPVATPSEPVTVPVPAAPVTLPKPKDPAAKHPSRPATAGSDTPARTPAVPAQPSAPAHPGKVADDSGKKRSEHEVVTPPLHETDEQGHSTDRGNGGTGH